MNMKSEYFKNILTVFSGTVVAQLVPILLSPILSRLYTPEVFGVYAFIMSIGMIAAAFASSQYNHAIMLEAESGSAKVMVVLSTLVTILASCLVFIGVGTVVFIFKLPAFDKMIFSAVLLPLYVLFSGLISTLIYWNNREKKYSKISTSRVTSSVSTIVIQIVMALVFAGNPQFLLIGLVSGQLLSLSYLLYSTPSIRTNLLRNTSKEQMKQLGIKHKNFLVFTTFSDLLNISLMQLPIILLTKLVGATPTGQFAFSNKMLGLPITFVSSSVGEVFKQKATEEYQHTHTSINTLKQTFKGLSLVSIIPFVTLFIFAPDIFAFIFGEEWREAGVYTRIMTPMFFFKFTVSPLTYIYYINGRQKEDFILHIIMLVFVVASLYWGYVIFHSVEAMLLCYSICFSLVYIFYLTRSFHLCLRS